MNGRTVLLGALAAAFPLVAALPFASGGVPMPLSTSAAAVPVAVLPAPETGTLVARCDASGVTAPAADAAGDVGSLSVVTSPATGELPALVAALDAGADGDEMVRALCELLASGKADAAEVPPLVRDAQRSDLVCLRLVQALGRCGDGSCQAALVAIAGDCATSVERRGAALRALGGVEAPSAAALAALWSHARNDDAPAAAVRAFGHATVAVRAIRTGLGSAKRDR